MPGHFLPQPFENPPNALAARTAAPGSADGNVLEHESGIPWQNYLRAVRRFRWLILVTAALGMVGGVVATRFVRPTYEVHATVWVSTTSPDERNAGPLAGRSVISAASWPELLVSSTILDRVAERERLYILPQNTSDITAFANFTPAATAFRTGSYVLNVEQDKRYTLMTAKDSVLERGSVGDSIGRTRGFQWAPTAAQLGRPRRISFILVTPRESAGWLRDQLFVDLARDGNLMRVSLTGSDPVRTAATLNAVVQHFVTVAAQLRKRSLVETTRAVELQLRYAGADLADAETALERFNAQTITLPYGASRADAAGTTTDPAVDAYLRSQTTLDSLTHERTTLDRFLADAKTDSSDTESFWLMLSGTDLSPELHAALDDYATKRGLLRDARLVYTDANPKVQELRGALQQLGTQVIPQLVVEQRTEVAAREAEQRQTTEKLERALRTIPARAMEEARLQRNLESRSALYTNLRSRFEEARLAEASAVPDVSILDLAVPPLWPMRNVRPRIFAAVFVGICGLGVLLALLLDRLDPRFRYLDQATKDLGLHVFGTVPHLSARRVGAAAALETAHLVETFREVRVALRYAFPPDRPVVLTVTSPGPGDGKSFVASNLAFSFAEAGYRTLLIDADIRRGSLHTIIGKERGPGLVDLLREQVTLADVLSSTSHERLAFISCGQRYRSGPELLASARFVTLLGQLATMYDAVVVDSAPLSVGVDSYVLSMTTGATLMVLRANRTNRNLAAATIGQLSRTRNHVLGTVINDVRGSGGGYRYYSYDVDYDTEFREDTRPPYLRGLPPVRKHMSPHH